MLTAPNYAARRAGGGDTSATERAWAQRSCSWRSWPPACIQPVGSRGPRGLCGGLALGIRPPVAVPLFWGRSCSRAGLDAGRVPCGLLLTVAGSAACLLWLLPLLVHRRGTRFWRSVWPCSRAPQRLWGRAVGGRGADAIASLGSGLAALAGDWTAVVRALGNGDRGACADRVADHGDRRTAFRPTRLPFALVPCVCSRWLSGRSPRPISSMSPCRPACWAMVDTAAGAGGGCRGAGRPFRCAAAIEGRASRAAGSADPRRDPQHGADLGVSAATRAGAQSSSRPLPDCRSQALRAAAARFTICALQSGSAQPAIYLGEVLSDLGAPLEPRPPRCW